MSRRVVVGLTVGACVFAVAGTAQAKGAGRYLPKGTPYAAEVRATILATIDANSHLDQVTPNVCETQSSEEMTNEVFDVKWHALYRNVTVPIADGRDLGKAATRLHVPAEPTSPGTGGAHDSTYDISGFGPPTQQGDQLAGGSDCTKHAFSGKGDYSSTGKPENGRFDFNDDFGPRHLFTFEMPPITPKPATYAGADGGQVAVPDDLTNITEGVNQHSGFAAKPGWNIVYADFDIDQLRKLRTQSKVTLHLVNKGTHDCSDHANGVTCDTRWNYNWTVILQRKFFYRTKQRYRR